ncbi:endonuclease MutS2 [Wukongibacter baidiensis]|uniref:endonuclease MutS2 n=1 Tax=Wukongibacter baidiensis TaxID=1723361 RepID=UPI003D7FA7F7
MNTNTIKMLEYDKIKDILMEYALSEEGKGLVKKLEPSIDIEIIKTWLEETTEAKKLLESNFRAPLHSLTGIGKIMEKLDIDYTLNPEEMAIILDFARNANRMKNFMKTKTLIAPRICTYAMSIDELEDVREEIDKCIRNGRVDDKASPQLAKIRKRIGILEDRIKAKFQSILNSPAYSKYIQDNLIGFKEGRYVIPIKREYRKNINGRVVETSGSGSTVFIEPEAVGRIQQELSLLKAEEHNEEYKILAYLTNLIMGYNRELKINIETMSYYDFIFAKAKYSKTIGGNTAKLNTRKYINIRVAKHPLIGESAVPLNFIIGDKYRSLVITGPNTGGKTVALKTVGLLTMMVQSGMHVPIETNGEFAIFNDILVDIGDGQSIEQNLSTFSSHISNIIGIVECADDNSLIILDELGAGTDPTEGMGLATSLLEEIHRKGSTIMATTHYSEIKEFANNNDGFENGCMEFDLETLKPLYRLKIGKSGDSNGFNIALRLGMDKRIIERAHEISYKENKDYSEVYKRLSEIKEVKNIEVTEHHEKQLEKLKRTKINKKKLTKEKVVSKFNIGDRVYISSLDDYGIVYSLEDGKGDVGVMVKKKKLKVNKKRLSLHIEAENLYPENYDLDIVFETKENRKKKKLMNKKYVKGLQIEVENN